MLVTPLPGVVREGLVSTLRELHRQVSNLLGGPATGGSYQWLVSYLDWANEAARTLTQQVSRADVDHLVLTKRYELLLSLVGGLTPESDGAMLNRAFVPASEGRIESTEPNRVANGLLSTELAERSSAFETAHGLLQHLIERWSRPGAFVVLDTSVYLTHPRKLEDLDLAELLDVDGEDAHLLVPMVVVEELDGQKQRGDKNGRWRAAYSLALLDRILRTPREPGLLRARDAPGTSTVGVARGALSIELLFDPPAHVRLPVNDDEIIDRTLAAQALAGRPITLITYDTSQAFKARAVGVSAKRLPHPSEAEDEPKSARSARRTERGETTAAPAGDSLL